LLFELLTEVLRLLPSSVLVFDGLDECEESPEADELFDFLLGLKAEPTVKTKILLLSQRTPFLEHRFQDSNNIGLCARTMSEPLRVYLHRRTEANEKLQPLKSDIVRTVHEGSQGLFLWASLMLDSLEDADSIIQQRRLLQEPPRGLIEMYQERLNNHQKTLPDDHIRQRDEIFLLLAGHSDHVGLDTICEALFLDTEPDVPVEEKGFFHPAKQVKQICGSFVDVCGKDVQFSHSSARQFIERLHAANGQNPYEYLLRISLRKLREPHYRDWRTCLRLLWENIFGGEKVPKELDFHLLESALYDHACLNWHTYATRLSRLPEDIVDDFRSFLVGNEFVTWSENLYVLRNKSGFEGQLNVATKLRDWYATLDPDTRPELPVSTVFIGAHENLSRDLENVAGNVLARFLPLMRLGRFLNLGARSFRELQQDLDYKTVVAEGFLRHLGPRNPMTLQAQLAMYADYLWKGPYDYALDRLQEVYELQRDVLGQDSMELLGTKTMIAGAYYRLGQLRVSAKILREVLDTLLLKVGDTSKDFLAGELFLGQVNEIAGNVEEATRLFHDVEKKWVDKNGKTSLFAAALFTGFGSVYRRQSNFEDSAGYLLDAWSQRYRIQTIEHPLCVDSALQLAILFRDANKPDMTKDFLDQVSNSSVFEMSFERVCQRTHVVACLAFDAGEYEEPRNVLQALIMQSTGEDREKNNRELLWVRLNLAEAMRRHDEADAALMLFTELVTPVREDNNSDTVSINTLHDEPEPVHQLEIAETALQLTRDGRSDQADSLLQQKGLAWVRTQDFWIIFGGPMADTATMRLRPPADVKAKD
jgi:tetratricopeptide (TPR) repeat protein